ncbi:metal ABC transporter permease [Aliiruegeria sabulilitoris]|uniref:metal ABC transporter permease n=1 Tax=Aliiruegeria sabulilitoris TaxID=1510458 RepID=UPI000835D0BF|nr:metal ABC transporter permease [Aliiruegeria sabulilitoris]NDR56601.1 metal ABC transporter permease [Pseudoruegeria sp. M32A2M]
MLFEALALQLGYNATLVAIGSALLGISAGVTGTFLFLRKRALVSDAISHATLPGVGLAFIVMVLLGGDGRNLAGLMAGSALSAWIGLICVQSLTRRTRLSEDAAIGAILSVFFGFGVVLLTIIQSMSSGRQAGLDGLLLGSTAGMLMQDAMIIAGGGAITLALVLLLRRAMTLVAFDPQYARSIGIDPDRVDMLTMLLVLSVTVVGLKIVGLILIVALLIIPPVTARFWTERSEKVATYAGVVGGVSGYVGAAISASTPDMPTGPIIVLTCFALFLVSLFLAPERGVLAAYLRHRRFQEKVHIRQGLLSLAQQQPVYEPLTIRLLAREGLARLDGVPTEAGRARAAKALLDEHRWQIVHGMADFEAISSLYDGLRDIESVLTADQLAEIDALIGGPAEVTP